MTTETLHFKARTHILSLLGDQLIGSDNLAVFELVKNAYDADAEKVTITFRQLNTPDQAIIIEDNGCGMSTEILQSAWLEIGTDSKRGPNRKPSPKYKRLALGEKGVGRLAVHKLGRKITLETKTKADAYSSRFTINWQTLIESSDYIEGAKVELETLEENLFPGMDSGTRIIISDLKKEEWSRKDLRELVRKVNTIKNPFRSIQQFDVDIVVDDDHKSWIEDLKNTEDLLKDSMYVFNFYLNRDARLTWTYRFNPPKLTGISSHKNCEVKKLLKLLNSDVFEGEKKQIHLKPEDLENIGPLSGRFYVYNLSSAVLRLLGQNTNIKQFVRDNCGVKLYRDGIRVYNYGEPSDDWLGLDLRRVQRAGDKFSKNVVVGVIELSLKESFEGLKEKTNREGFDDSIYFERLKTICLSIVTEFETEAGKDRQALQNYVEKTRPVKRVGFSDTINELKEKITEKKVEQDLMPLVNRVEQDYATMRDVMLNSGMTGINLGLIFHEIEREVQFLNAEVQQDFDANHVRDRVKSLGAIIENFTPLVKQNKNIIIHASQLVQRVFDIERTRFNVHDIVFSSPLTSGETEDFQIRGPGNLLLSSLSNIVDNAIYWTCSQREIVSDPAFKARIVITSDTKNLGGNAIIIADNGEGFRISEEELRQPFKTTRPGGMGLGLYFVGLVMNMVGGKLVFLKSGELDLPAGLDGAIVALVFPQK